MYKIFTLILITIVIGLIALFQYPPVATQTKEFNLNKKILSISSKGSITPRKLNIILKSSQADSEMISSYNPSCEIELYRKFSHSLSSKRFLENYLVSIVSADTPKKVLFAQDKLIRQTKFSDIYFHNLLNKNLRDKISFIDKITKRTICKVNQ